MIKTGPSGVIPIAVLKEESNVKIVVPVFSFLVTYILQCEIHIRVNGLTYFFLKSFFLCYLLSLSESFFQFYHLVWFQT